MDAKEYKKFHENHMSNNSGTSTTECIILLSSIPLSCFLASFLSPHIHQSLYFYTEFFIIIFPVILNCTIFSEINHIIFTNLILLCATIILLKIDIKNLSIILDTELWAKKPFISNYRSCTNFFSALCILAVDFMIFPKRLAKTESFGFGFMDLGVGFFICSNAFVEKHKAGEFRKLLKTLIILSGLGFIRVLSVKATDYHEHVSEYGVHWNFFFTLALCRLLSYIILVVSKNANPLYLSVIIGSLHQTFLMVGLQEWVLGNTPRDSVLSANREGLVSSLGYVTLYFGSSALGKYILHLPKLNYKKLLTKLTYVCIPIWLAYLILEGVFGVSRRLVNLGYVFWILALTTTMLILFIILEVSLLVIGNRNKTSMLLVPAICESINANGLFFFLLSNLLTGLVNSVFQTLLLDTKTSMSIIIGYMMVLCGITHILWVKNVKLKI